MTVKAIKAAAVAPNQRKGEIISFIRGTLSLALTALREIFDESAYDRFLVRRGLTCSPGSYSAFLQEQRAVKAQQIRCC